MALSAANTSLRGYAELVVRVVFIMMFSMNSGNGKLATWGCIAGFMVMMCLDVGLG